MGTGRMPRLHFHSQHRHGSLAQLQQPILGSEDAVSSPQDPTPASRYTLGPQHDPSPMRPGMPADFHVDDGQMWAPSHGVLSASPSAAEARVDGSAGSRVKPAAPLRAAGAKSRRVRTGCLTCRERHLKCDEGLPECHNCRKSNRECRRGIRLNFIDVQVRDPPCLPPTAEWSVRILDESRSIASEYKGGLGRYPKETPPPPGPGSNAAHRPTTTDAAASTAKGSAPELGGRGTPYGIRNPDRPSDVGHPPPQGPRRDHAAGQLGQSTADDSLMAARTTSPVGGLVATDHDAYALTSLHGSDLRRGSAGRAEPDSRNRHGLHALHTPRVPMLHDLAPSGPGGLEQERPGTPPGFLTPPNERTTAERDYLSGDEEIRFLQAFIDGVAVWMDAFDKDKHFANTVPYLALKLPMLLNALLACGARHLALIGAHDGEKAKNYYSTATAQLLRTQQLRDCGPDECALTAVVLNAYDLMGDEPAERLGLIIASTRALIRECGWDASSYGLGAACFWVNVGMEVLSCVALGWPTASDPEQWGLDLEFVSLDAASRSGSRSVAGSNEVWSIPAESQRGGGCGGGGGRPPGNESAAELGGEELWVHRIFYVLAKVANFCASTPKSQEPSPHDEQIRLQNRFAEWRRLQNLCNAWNHACPRSMRPFGYSPGPSPRSLFPNVWLIKPAAKLGRLFYHTAMCLLAWAHPLEPHGRDPSRNNRETRASQLHHAHHVCGIVAHAFAHARAGSQASDHGIPLLAGVGVAFALAAVRCLAAPAVGAALVDPAERTELLALLGRIARETGWRVGTVVEELRAAWGWDGGAGNGIGVSGAAMVMTGMTGVGSAPSSLRAAAGEGLAVGGSNMGGGRQADEWPRRRECW